MKKTVAVWIVAMLALVAVLATGCALVPDRSAEQATPVTYYRETDGVLDESVWITLSGDKWQDSGYLWGTVEYSGVNCTFKNRAGETVFTGVLKKGMLALTKGDETEFYYEEGMESDNRAISIQTVYEAAKDLGFTGTLEELIDAFQGDSAYEIAVSHGFTGTEEAWLATLVGRQGEKGAKGDQGEKGEKGDTGVSITKIEKTSSNAGVDTYTITMSDGSTYTYDVTNGKNGKDGKDGLDAPQQILTAEELFAFAQEKGFAGTYEEFLALFAPKQEKDVAYLMDALRYTVTIRTSSGSGSGIIYKLDKENGDAYVMTNFHVTHNGSAKAGQPLYETEIKVYLYGSEVSANDTTDAEEMGIPATYVGGSNYFDVAIIRIEGSELLKNSIASEAKFGDSETVYTGQDVIVVGDAEGEGISVTEGIVSMPSENIAIADTINSQTYVSRRVIRTDSAINLGNSGGPLVGSDGYVYGVVSAKTTSTNVDNMGYAVPANNAVTIAERLIRLYEEGDGSPVNFYRPLVGVTIYPKTSHAVIGEDGIIRIEEDIYVDSVSEGGLCDGLIEKGEHILSVKVADNEKERVIHMHTVVDAVMTAEVGDAVKFEVENTEGVVREVTVTITQKSINVEEIVK